MLKTGLWFPASRDIHGREPCLVAKLHAQSISRYATTPTIQFPHHLPFGLNILKKTGRYSLADPTTRGEIAKGGLVKHRNHPKSRRLRGLAGWTEAADIHAKMGISIYESGFDFRGRWPVSLAISSPFFTVWTTAG
jgi:hypothetical protein